jgi:HAD superfamily hydrolase (TIGR01509 family)
MGHPNADIADFLFPGDPRADALIDRKEALFRTRLAAAVSPVAGVHSLLDWAEAEGAGVAVVTNAPRANAEAMLAAAGLAARLTELVIGDECVRPKPDPAPYQEAMRRLGATPSRSIAFEDSRSGLRAVRASGAYAFGIATGLTDEELLQAGAHQAIPDFTAPALWSALQTLKARVA